MMSEQSICGRETRMKPPPWTFPNARVLYQPAFVRVDAARAVTPTTGLTLLSLFGWTLGGTFVVEWTDSPIGPYREVAVLSGLVARGFNIGAWASHIIVTTPDAVDSGREFFGLPTNLGTIAFEPSEGAAQDATTVAMGRVRELSVATALVFKTALGTAAPGIAEPAERLGAPEAAPRSCRFVFDADDAARVLGWDGWLRESDAEDDATDGGLALSLPSFSGCLSVRGEDGISARRTSALLRYPLRLGPARRVRLRPAAITTCGADVSDELRSVLGGPMACPCVQVDGVRVVAGMPTEETDAE